MIPVVWSNRVFRPEGERLLSAAAASFRLIRTPHALASDAMAPLAEAPGMEEAEIAFGQPPVEACFGAPRLRWIHVTSAGYTRYDTPEFWERMQAKGVAFTSSSAVFADPCAQHVLAMILALGRELLPSYEEQRGSRAWDYETRRYRSDLLTGQTLLLLGYGSIARRLAELLAPFQCRIYALRRQARSERGVRVIAEADLTAVLPQVDHLVNVMPDNAQTRHWVNARRLSCLKAGARFYNVGRGATVDEEALAAALESGRLRSAYLDVTETEPLPKNHPLWDAPNCYITPHTAGGRRDQDEAIVSHFLDNLAAFAGGRPLRDRVR